MAAESMVSRYDSEGSSVAINWVFCLSESPASIVNDKGIFVSAQSTCGSKSHAYSYVLQAMGIKNERLHGVIRLSLSHLNTMDEMRTIVEVVKENVKKYGI